MPKSKIFKKRLQGFKCILVHEYNNYYFLGNTRPLYIVIITDIRL